MVMSAVLVEQGILDGEPIVAVSYLKPEQDWDSPNGTTESVPVHIRCFLDDHPEAGEGMDLARQHGEAISADLKWIASS
jgi:hypothetical protein